MCYEHELYWWYRAERMREDQKRADEPKEREKAATPAETGGEVHEPAPA
jgi:hypothetical protein